MSHSASANLTPSVTIRAATRQDAALIHHFITELAIYEKAESEVKASVTEVAHSLFGPEAHASALICESAGQEIGFAVYFYSYSTWLGKKGLYLEDLYISPQHRGTGAGKAVFLHLAKLALAQDCGRFEWSVLDWNTPAIEFYQSVGAQPQSEWIRYRMDEAAIRRFVDK